ncbi:MAG: hypothetical protein JSR83_03195 [Proteobacteria bacterium]|nr:hypothetical protein [Pseudomonadota bacterium]
MRARGLRPVLVLRDTSRVLDMFGPFGLGGGVASCAGDGAAIEFTQAPMWLAPRKGLPDALNFTETLFLFGFLSPAGLLSVVQAWRNLFRLIAPDLLVFDSAPTAMLAARGLGIPSLVTGNSFAVPPQVSPLPPYEQSSGVAVPGPRELETEARCVRNANEVLMALGAPPIEHVCELFAAEETLIAGTPELDVYGRGMPERFIGPIGILDKGCAPVWPSVGRRRIFAYLKAHSPNLDDMLAALARLNAATLVVAPGLSSRQIQSFTRPNLRFAQQALRMDCVREECDLAVGHGGAGMVDLILGAGKPLVLLPLQMEQVMTSRRVAEAGCGAWVTATQSSAAFDRVLSHVLEGPEFARQARAYAARNATYSERDALERFVTACERLIVPS